MDAFIRRPDVLDLIAEFEYSDDLKVQKPMTPFGVLDSEILCFRDTPIGLLAGLVPYHAAIGEFGQDAKLVLLAPSLPASEPFPALRPESFQQALEELLGKRLLAWTLVCERDCEQEDLLRVEAGTPQAAQAFTELFNFLHGGADVRCPTFLVEKRKRNREVNP